MVDGRVWFTYDTNFGSLDVSGAEPVVHLAQDGERRLLGAGRSWLPDPAVPGVLAAGNGGKLAVYDVSADGATLRVKGDMDTAVRQLDLTPDGQPGPHIMGRPGLRLRPPGAYSTTDLTEQVGRYPIDALPERRAPSPRRHIAGGSSSWYEPDVHIHRPATPRRRGSTTSPTPATAAAPTPSWTERSPGLLTASRVFAVSVNTYGTYTLRALTDPTKELPGPQGVGPHQVGHGPRSSPSPGKLTSKTSPAGTSLKVTRTDIESSERQGTGRRQDEGRRQLLLQDTPSAGGKVTYKVSYAGDADARSLPPAPTRWRSPAQSHLAEPEQQRQAVLRLRQGRRPSPRTSVRRTRAAPSRSMQTRYGTDIAEEAAEDGTRSIPRGNVSAIVDMTRDTTVTAVFAGDARSASKTVKSTAYAREDLHRRLQALQDGQDRLHDVLLVPQEHRPGVHHNDELLRRPQAALPAPGVLPGLLVRLGLRSTLPWARTASRPCRLEAAGESGIRARMRSSYINSSSGDTV